MSVRRLGVLMGLLAVLAHGASALSPRPVTGANVTRVEFGTPDDRGRRLGHFEQVGARQWQEFGSGRARFDFRETGRDDWSVYLYDRSRDLRVQLDLHTRWVYVSERSSGWRELYRILRVAERPPAVAAYDSRGSRCADAVQGRIAWDYEGNTRWNPDNVEGLCADAPDEEPARCFSQVMHGGVNWGGGTRWRWRNALNLCAGTVNARATIACFEGQLALTRSWEAAIDRCRR